MQNHLSSVIFDIRSLYW